MCSCNWGLPPGCYLRCMCVPLLTGERAQLLLGWWSRTVEPKVLMLDSRFYKEPAKYVIPIGQLLWTGWSIEVGKMLLILWSLHRVLKQVVIARWTSSDYMTDSSADQRWYSSSLLQDLESTVSHASSTVTSHFKQINLAHTVRTSTSTSLIITKRSTTQNKSRSWPGQSMSCR